MALIICFKTTAHSLLQTRTSVSWASSLQLLCRPNDRKKFLAAMAGYLRGDGTSVLPRYLTCEWNIKKSVLSLNLGVQRLAV